MNYNKLRAIAQSNRKTHLTYLRAILLYLLANAAAFLLLCIIFVLGYKVFSGSFAGFDQWSGNGPADDIFAILWTVPVVIISMVWFHGHFDQGHVVTRRRYWPFVLMCVAFALFEFIPEGIVEDFLALPDDISDSYQDHYHGVMGTTLMFISTAIVPPIMEELMCRGVILRYLLKMRWNAWWAIIISALFFSILHFNWAQMPGALFSGIVWGWIYWKVRSIVPTMLMHMVNNLVIAILIKIPGIDAGGTMLQMFGGNAPLLYAVAAVCLVLQVITLIKMVRFFKK